MAGLRGAQGQGHSGEALLAPPICGGAPTHIESGAITEGETQNRAGEGSSPEDGACESNLDESMTR